jgi:hypothetical protein
MSTILNLVLLGRASLPYLAAMAPAPRHSLARGAIRGLAWPARPAS